ncbi:OLC1v1033312C1 [Oldenlandia corymbosa var. corymbosa]|uniref:OLC1v1033312C1 n=1 Tax=Oldenlandia corymbosa var. corymbosa TaxID=529605 RepID=A0AAV1CMX8_OLDCO|nr:OLC1v1033312C1 [Oldenlandia corymbosa var. corymbosa]
MAQLNYQDSPPKKDNHHPPPRAGRSGCFPGCFGFSDKSSTQKVKQKKKTKSCLPFKSLRKSVPVIGDEDAITEKLHQKRKETNFRMPNLSKKFSAANNKLPPPADHVTSQTPRPVDATVDQTQIPTAAAAEAGHGGADHHNTNIFKEGDEDDQKINLENGKSMTNHSNSIPAAKEAPATYRKSVFFRRNSWSQPATSSPEQNSEISQQPAAATALTHSASMPPSSAGRLANGGGGYTGETSSSYSPSSQREEKDTRNSRSSKVVAGKFDQMVGMSIIVVTLIIMVIWGKLCAILCTSAWLYFYPLLIRSTHTHIHPQPNHNIPIITPNASKPLDLEHVESKKSKKKVVFEGFLERSHRAKGG